MWIVFSDLDGTLLDFDSYDYRETLPHIKSLKGAGIPLIIVTSKTRREMILWRRRLKIYDPFVVENGGAVFVPVGYRGWRLSWSKKDRFWFKILGFGRERLKEGLVRLGEGTEFEIRTLSSLGLDEVIRLTNLNKREAELAMKREFSEPFLLLKGDPEELKGKAEEMGFRIIKGRRFYHLTGPSDKGKAVKFLKNLYRKMEKTNIKSAAIGDSANDLPMLQEVDYPFLVEKEKGIYEDVENGKIKRIPERGPRGWVKAVTEILKFQNFENSGGQNG
jgi:mannosyl-3-phosphoglycerate phosphatase